MPLLSTADVARTLGASHDYVRDHAVELGAIRPGGRYGALRFTEDGVRRFVEARRLRAPERRARC